MYRSTSPGWKAARDLLFCLAICALVAAFDHDALRNPIRRAIMMFVIIAVPAGNYFMYRRHNRPAR